MTDRFRVGVASGLFALALAGAGWAQEKRETGAGQEDVRKEFALVSLDVKGLPLVDVLKKLSSDSGVNIVPDLGIEDRVTVTLVDVPWREALDVVCQQTKCIYKEVSPRLIRVMKPPRVTADFKNSPLVEIIDILANKAGSNIVISPDIDAKIKITMRFQNIPWEDALDALVRTAGYASVTEPSGIIRIVHPDKLVTQMETRVFTFKYMRPPDLYRPKIKGDTMVGDPKGIDDALKEFTVIDALNSSLSRKGTTVLGSLKYIQSTNSVIVTDTRPVLDQIQKIIDRLDTEPFQVHLEVKVVSTRNSDLAQVGILYTTGAVRGISVGSSTVFTPNSPHSGPDYFGDPPLVGSTSTFRRSRLPFGIGHDLVGSDTFFATNFNITATLRLFQQDTDSKVEQRPSISVLSDAEATLFVGEEVRWAETKAEQGQAGGLSFTLEEAEDSPIQVGFQLMVIPHVVPGTSKIVMTIIPKSNTLSGSSTILPGFDEFSLIGGAAPQTIFLPRVATSTVVTRMLVESGNTAVVGGLIEDRETQILDKIPLLGDIPLLGHLFRHTDKSKTKNHLIIFITPRLVRPSGDTITSLNSRTAAAGAREKGEHERLREGMSREEWEEKMKAAREEEAKEHERLKNGK
ncbi:MAG: hypothetical protein HYY18_10635 [Planctomycetes bacterium]|nr:hypothetical protein [Planctomycetota bacterium]